MLAASANLGQRQVSDGTAVELNGKYGLTDFSAPRLLRSALFAC